MEVETAKVEYLGDAGEQPQVLVPPTFLHTRQACQAPPALQLARDWFADLDYLTLSPKPPSSGMETDWEKLARCVDAGGSETETVMKVVVFDERDYAYAKEVGHCFPEVPIYLQVGNDAPPGPEAAHKTEPNIGRLLERYEWLAGKIVADGWNDATVLPQLHVLVWGNKRGV